VGRGRLGARLCGGDPPLGGRQRHLRRECHAAAAPAAAFSAASPIILGDVSVLRVLLISQRRSHLGALLFATPPAAVAARGVEGVPQRRASATRGAVPLAAAAAAAAARAAAAAGARGAGARGVAVGVCGVVVDVAALALFAVQVHIHAGSVGSADLDAACQGPLQRRLCAVVGPLLLLLPAWIAMRSIIVTGQNDRRVGGGVAGGVGRQSASL
jgi:hypothetical protein